MMSQPLEEQIEAVRGTPMGDRGELALNALHVLDPDGDGLGLAVLPDDWSVNVLDALEQYRAHPRRKRGAMVVTDTASFVAYVTRHVEAGSIITVDAIGRFKAVLDHHEPSVEGADRGQPGWADHTVSLERPFSTAWQQWRAFAGEWHSQGELAEFLEERRREIAAPEAATIIELAETFEATVEQNVSSHQRLPNSAVRILYESLPASTRTGRGEIEVPAQFRISIPIYRNEAEVEPLALELRLRWRIQAQHPQFMFVLPEALQEAFDARLESDIDLVAGGTGVPVFRVP